MQTDTVRVHSLPCPRCGAVLPVDMTQAEYDAVNNGEFIQKALARFSPEIRERFISGYCPKCWDELFADDDAE